MNTALRTLLALCILSLASSAWSADSPSPAESDPLAPAREQIAQKHWAAAIDALRQLNATGNADWNNLMGYSLRKSKTPDLDGAERYYDAALKIDPAHRGALEYSGELYLMKGDLATAEARLARLDKACRFSCEEYRDLKQAIERYKAAGNHYVPAP